MSAEENVKEGLRRRKPYEKTIDGDREPETNASDKAVHYMEPKLEAGSYWLTRILLLRSLAFVFFVAFLVALHQNKGLIGKDGLLPADKYLRDVKVRLTDSDWERFTAVPTVLWWLDYENNIDVLLDALAYTGLVLSGFVLITGGANMILMLVLWLTYHSIVNVGQRWYSFGWESQILETCFLAVFLCPLLSLKSVPRNTPTSFIAILGFRWLIFRIMLGAGLIKIRGDQCWRDLTCMNYHYETQPVPNPNAYFLHQSPELVHKFETLSNHFIELIAPFFILLNRRLRLIGGFIQVFFQVVLIISGNLSFLNWLTIIPALACFDDKSISWMFSGRRGSAKWQVYQIQQDERNGKAHKLAWSSKIRKAFNVCYGLFVIYRSIPVVENMVALSSKQKMNHFFEPLRMINSYGKFGSITKERTEVIFQGTYALDPKDPNAKWEEYEFNCKPGNISRRPCVISPYHYRLDWLMWFAAFQNYQYNNWLVHLAGKFLVNDKAATSLIAYNPFEGKDPPRFVRAEHYRYKFPKIGSNSSKEGKWWVRKKIGEYLPPVNVDSLKEYVGRMGWKPLKKKGLKKKQK